MAIQSQVRDIDPPEMVSLSSLKVSKRFTVQRIPEELEFQPGMLDFLEEANVVPGATGNVVARSPDGTITLEVAGSPVGPEPTTPPHGSWVFSAKHVEPNTWPRASPRLRQACPATLGAKPRAPQRQEQG